MILRITMAPTAENPPGTAGHSPRRKSGRARHSVRAVVPRISSSDLSESPSTTDPCIPSPLRGERARVRGGRIPQLSTTAAHEPIGEIIPSRRPLLSTRRGAGVRSETGYAREIKNVLAEFKSEISRRNDSHRLAPIGRARHSVRAVVPRITSSDLSESPSLANPRIPSPLRGERARVRGGRIPQLSTTAAHEPIGEIIPSRRPLLSMRRGAGVRSETTPVVQYDDFLLKIKCELNRFPGVHR
jgi:hypothetical protein